MANYALTLKVLGPDTLKNIGTAIHDYLETIDSTKVIHLKEVERCMGDYYEAIILHDT